MYIGAFDIGGTKTIVALADETGKILGRKQFDTNTKDCYGHFDNCIEEFQTILKQQHLQTQDIAACGINLPGVVDRQTGTLLRAVFAKWMNIPVKEYFQKQLRVEKIVCENDVNSCAYGELLFGLGKQYDNFIWMTVSTGVGGAFVNERKVIEGAHGVAGEVGHIKVEYEHPALCPCGQYGCLETHASGNAIQRNMQQYPSLLSTIHLQGLQPTAASCASLALQGNIEALQIFQDMGKYLGRGIATCVNLFDPEVVILGGGVSKSFDLFAPSMQETIQQTVFLKEKHIPIQLSALGYDAALMGAIAIAKKELEETWNI